MTSPDEMQTVGVERQRKRGEMIAVCSAKGGIGRTILTVNLAVALFKKNISVAILDGDFQFGDVGLAMDLQSTFTIKEVIEGIATLDEHSLAGYLCHHDSGVKVLPATDRPEYADLVSKEAVNKISDLMLLHHDYVVVDTGVGLNDHTINFVERADQILIVTNLEMAALKNTKLMLETLEILGLREKARVVINRANMESVIQATDAANILDEKDPIYIPNDFHICSQSLNIGIPFVINQTKTDVAKGVYKMAEMITSRREIITFKTSKSQSLLSKWLPRKRTKGGGNE
ncbi:MULTISPECIES: AAA family ATPase [unclassified Bacillus (in: firmicutes)]|uniref:AAA family ATPase n=1 Tax=unclassified Bacillus (in: firmicutes) TaxID=185979 RepID=UPI0008E7CD71|nr:MULTISPECIES: AAA family ATPase [unclassified Bacillus (in: firmicutes)]SFA79333.1 pilus assembly protein CpaE [Bacillus sp. UNCCL13]SFQ69321.1 pilus assembly protein CpaE [Bacillus sp. cl95]